LAVRLIRKKFVDGAADKVVDLIKKHDLNNEVFLGNSTQPLKDMNLKELAEKSLEWGQNSAQGLCCGIFGCNTEPEIRCKICGGGYCKDHKNWHFHSETNDGIYEKDTDEI
jgi:hypothetical protein